MSARILTATDAYRGDDSSGFAADHEDAEEAAVGDGAAGGDGEALRAGPTAERAGDADGGPGKPPRNAQASDAATGVGG